MSGRFFSFTLLRLFFLETTIIFAAQPANATNYYWGVASGNWSVPANWGGTEPTLADDAYINNGGTAEVNQLGPQCNTLHLGDAGAGSSGTVQISAGGTLRLKSLVKGAGSAAFNFGGGTLQAEAAFSAALPMSLTGTGGAAKINTNGFDVTLSGLLSGAGGLTKLGNGTLTLSAASTYSGNTAISAGTIKVSNSLALQNSTLDYGSGGGSLNFTQSSITLGGLVGDHALTLNYGSLPFINPVDLSVGKNGQSGTFSGAIDGMGSLNKIGAGTLTLAGDNSYGGNTKVSGGTLTLGHPNALKNSTLDYNSYGGTLTFGSLTNATFGGLKGNQSLTLTNDAATAVNLTVGGSGLSYTYSGSFSGLGSLAKVGTGALTLSGANSHAGETILSAGTIYVAHANALQNSTLDFRASSSALIFSLTAATFGGLKGDHDLTLTYVSFGSQPVDLSVGGNGQSGVFSGAISGLGSLGKFGGGTLALTGTNTYAGNTAVNAGTLLAKKPGSLPGYDATGRVAVNAGGTLAVNAGGAGEWAAANIQTLLTKTAFNEGSTLGIDTTNAAGGNFIYANPIEGNIGLIKLGAGTLSLGGANAYTGNTTISAGTLAVANSSALPSTTLVFSGGTLQATGAFTATLPMSLTGIGGDAKVDTNGFDLSLSGQLSGSGGLEKLGTGKLSLGGTNIYNGNTTISAGTLALANSSALPSTTLVFSGGTLQAAGAFTATLPMSLTGVGGDAKVDTNGFDLSLSGQLSGSGGLEKLGAGTLTLTGALDYAGNTFVNEGTLTCSMPLNAPAASVSVAAGAALNGTSLVADSLNIGVPMHVAAVAAVPEPGTLALLALAGLGVLGSCVLSVPRRK
jgi:fibronectin-binding autotransporter adhesin